MNDLLTQRQDIVNKANQTEFDILTRGSLTRGRTAAQSKMGEIEQVKVDEAKQLNSINRQIDLAQFKYDSEKSIFNLSQNRVAMELSLLNRQKEQVVFDTQRIQALSNLVTQLKSGGDIQGLLAFLGYSSPSLASSVASAYNTNARQGLGGYYAP